MLLLRGVSIVSHLEWEQVHAAIHQLEMRIFPNLRPAKHKRAPAEIEDSVPARTLLWAMGEEQFAPRPERRRGAKAATSDAEFIASLRVDA